MELLVDRVRGSDAYFNYWVMLWPYQSFPGLGVINVDYYSLSFFLAKIKNIFWDWSGC